jgi:hypothetical protein
LRWSGGGDGEGEIEAAAIVAGTCGDGTLAAQPAQK